MMIPKLRRCAVLILIFSCVLLNISSAQHFIQLTEEQWIELALDMMRKGIQQQDTTKVFMVFAPQVERKGKGTEVHGNLSNTLQAIFDNSSKRTLSIEKPSFPREDNPLHFSNFWDFDILDPQIKIQGDSAIVDCELVLWGASPVKGTNQAVGDPVRGGSRRTKERFIFKCPPKIKKVPTSDDRLDKTRWSGSFRTARPTGSHKWPASPSGKERVRSIRSWRLVGFEKLLDFLNEETEGSHEQSRQKEGK